MAMPGAPTLRLRSPCALPVAPRRARCPTGQPALPHPAAPRRSAPRGDAQVARFQPTSDARMSKRQAELAVRKLYLFNFWYAAGFCKNVRDDAFLATKLLDTHVLIWRSRASERLLCITDECPRTGRRISEAMAAPLEATDDEGRDIITVNGTTYNVTTGHALGDTAQPALEVFDCAEQGGFVWLFFGDHNMPADMRPDIPSVPELQLPGWHAVHGEVHIKANHWTVIENVIDMAHVPYVHKGTVGNHAAFVDIVIERLPNAINFSFPIENHHGEGESAAFHVDTKATACLPSTSFIRFKFPLGLHLVTINSVVPIDGGHTCIRFCQMRNFARTRLFDPVIHKGMENILGEDKVILEQLRPEEVTTEVSLKADAPQLEFRSMRAAYIAAGSAVQPGPRPLHSLPQWRDTLLPGMREE